MKAFSGKEMVTYLEAHGWRLVRVHGSHHVFVKEGRRERISVPVHAQRALKKGLQSAILKIVGIENDEER